MKKILILLFALVYSQLQNPVNAQPKSCCSSGTMEFDMLGSDDKFQSAHNAPEPFHYQNKTGSMISFNTPDGGKGNAFMVPAMVKSDNYLFVFHEWWGLNDYIRLEAEQFAEELGNVNVIAIDLYDGQLATNPDDAGRIMQSIKQERAEAIIKGVEQYIRANSKIQTIGWCFGGGWSLQAAMLLGDKAKGCVIYYGMPEKDEAKLKKLNAPVLGIFATNDGWINSEVVRVFENQMREMNKSISTHWFEADHAFANPSNPKFDKAAAQEARKLSLDFIKGNFE
jgi:carboxymethylenebutenolidase